MLQLGGALVSMLSFRSLSKIFSVIRLAFGKAALNSSCVQPVSERDGGCTGIQERMLVLF